MDSSALTILPSQVRVPSTPSMLLTCIVKFVPSLSCEKYENKQKEAGFGPLKNTVKKPQLSSRGGRGCGGIPTICPQFLRFLRFTITQNKMF